MKLVQVLILAVVVAILATLLCDREDSSETTTPLSGCDVTVYWTSDCAATDASGHEFDMDEGIAAHSGDTICWVNNSGGEVTMTFGEGLFESRSYVIPKDGSVSTEVIAETFDDGFNVSCSVVTSGSSSGPKVKVSPPPGG